MKAYKNLSQKSGIDLYEIGNEFIRITFNHSRAIYTYNYQIPGKQKVEKMKRLAVSGAGLSTYISQVIRDNYYSKED